MRSARGVAGSVGQVGAERSMARTVAGILGQVAAAIGVALLRGSAGAERLVERLFLLHSAHGCTFADVWFP